ncbi:Transposase [Staphylococcus aureus]|nr:Transposase [Staphylococcus aureus]
MKDVFDFCFFWMKYRGFSPYIWLRKQRDNHSAYAFIKRLIKQFGKPQKVITDQAPSTKVAMAKVIKAFKLKPDCHCTSKYLNNLIEQDHRHIKVRKTRYQSINTAKNTLKGIECIYTLYKKNRRSLQIYGFSPCHEISIMLAS